MTTPSKSSEPRKTTADLVRRFAGALADKLAKAEQKYGYTDAWMNPGWEEECQKKLVEHIRKGDPRDVAAFCAFMWHHSWRTCSAESRAAQPQEWTVETIDEFISEGHLWKENLVAAHNSTLK
jgi:hypothetical protein